MRITLTGFRRHRALPQKWGKPPLLVLQVQEEWNGYDASCAYTYHKHLVWRDAKTEDLERGNHS